MIFFVSLLIEVIFYFAFQTVFKQFDADGSGKLSSYELRSALHTSGMLILCFTWVLYFGNFRKLFISIKENKKVEPCNVHCLGNYLKGIHIFIFSLIFVDFYPN